MKYCSLSIFNKGGKIKNRRVREKKENDLKIIGAGFGKICVDSWVSMRGKQDRKQRWQGSEKENSNMNLSSLAVMGEEDICI